MQQKPSVDVKGPLWNHTIEQRIFSKSVCIKTYLTHLIFFHMSTFFFHVSAVLYQFQPIVVPKNEQTQLLG